MPIAVLSQYIFGSLLFTLSFLIIAIILLQRGRGGGLTGALGGLGGQSAFGVKAGDIFTRITAVLVLLWITVCALAAWYYKENNLDIQADTSASTSISGGMGSSGLDLPPNSQSDLPGLPALPAAEPVSSPAPTESKPIESKEESDPKPAEPQPVEPQPVEPQPAESQSAESQSAEPSEPAPTEAPK
jgi:preprotein translocase subunit SecG